MRCLCGDVITKPSQLFILSILLTSMMPLLYSGCHCPLFFNPLPLLISLYIPSLQVLVSSPVSSQSSIQGRTLVLLSAAYSLPLPNIHTQTPRCLSEAPAFYPRRYVKPDTQPTPTHPPGFSLGISPSQNNPPPRFSCLLTLCDVVTSIKATITRWRNYLPSELSLKTAGSSRQ